MINLFDRKLIKQPFYMVAPKKEHDFKILASLCIHRVVDAYAMDSLIKLLHWGNPKVVFSRTTGDAMIDRARCQEASMFLKSDCDILLFIDDDIKYEPEDAIKVCKEAYERKGIVGATYVIKKEEYTWITAKPLSPDQVIRFGKGEPVTEVKWLATGFMAIHKNVLFDMIDRLKLPLCHPTDLKFYPFFLPMLYQFPNGDHIYMSEDWSFCERARQCGYSIYLDPSVFLGHSGRYVFELEDMARQPRPERGIIRYSENRDLNDVSKDLGERKEGEIKTTLLA